MTTPSLCPKCGATIPDGAPQGIVPKCVLLGATIPRTGFFEAGMGVSIPFAIGSR